MPQPEENTLSAKLRKVENLHIVFWLIKDLSWCMVWKPLGLLMIFPTLIIAIIICWRSRKLVGETAHNLAIVFWICANSYWMTSEFFNFEAIHIFGTYTYKNLAAIPFGVGLFILTWYYLWWSPRNNKKLASAILKS